MLKGVGTPFLGLLLLWSSQQSSTKAEDFGLTRKEAAAMPPSMLARHLLGEVGTLYTEAELSPPLWGFQSLMWIRFARPPRPSGNPGICSADVLVVGMFPREMPPQGEDLEAFVTHVDTGRLYKVVSDTAPVPDPLDQQHRSRMENACRESGRVLPKQFEADEPFFGESGGGLAPVAGNPYFAVRALEDARSRAFTIRNDAISCKEERHQLDPEICTDPRKTLKALDPRYIQKFEVLRCQNGVFVCARLWFNRPGSRYGAWRRIAVRLETDARERWPRGEGATVTAIFIEAHSEVI